MQSLAIEMIGSDDVGAGKQIEDAFRFAKNAVALEGIPGAHTPVLIRRDH